MEAFRHHAVGAKLAHLSAVSNRLWSDRRVACACRNIAALGVFCAQGNDVDDAVHGVRSPDRSTRAANHFYALNTGEGNVLGVPEDAGENRRIYRSTVNQDEELVGVLAVESAGTDGPVTNIDL